MNINTLLRWWWRLSLLGAGSGVALFLYAWLYEPLRIQYTERLIRIPHANGALPSSGLRILHLSDTHFRAAEWREQPKIDNIRLLASRLDYDLVVHTGDFIHTNEGVDNLIRLLEAIPKPRLGYYGVLGNHDYAHYATPGMLERMWNTFMTENELAQDSLAANDTQLFPLWIKPLHDLHRLRRFIAYVRNTPLDIKRTGANDIEGLVKRLEDWGMTILVNENRHIQTDALNFYLAGVDDWYEGNPELEKAFAGIPEKALMLLLSHNPDVMQDPRCQRAGLMLAGHTHGGQIVLPIWGAAHTQTTFIKRHNVAGHHWHESTQFYTSRGIGEGIPLRFMAKPQITLLNVRSS